jgi:translocation and assembly module TamB
MTRRRLVALVSVAVLVLLGLVGVSTVLFLTRTNAGREKIREIARPLIARAVKGGTVYLGKVSGSFVNGVTFDSVEIVDKRGQIFLATGRLTVVWNPRDLADSRLFFRRVEVEHPYLHLVQHENGVWNFREILASSVPQLPKPKELNTRGWGDYFVIDSASIHNGTVLLTMPWHPDSELRGAARDSSIRAHLADSAKAVTKTYDGYGRTYAWHRATGLVTHARLADPDSDKFGQEVHVAGLSVDEYEPTFKVRNLVGGMRHLGDSIWFEVPRFEMPASRGHGQGKIWWGHDHPVHYDVAIRGDSVALDDVHWVYATLPRTGGGAVDLAIENDPKDAEIVDFKLTSMDMRTTGSHLTGQMSFGINSPTNVLLVRDVDLRADPVDFDFLRTLNGKPFAEDWRGQLYGTVKGRGGPLTHFMVDDAQMRFDDAHVRGAVSRLSGKGELDILEPAYTAFHGFDVDAQTVDLRTIEYLFPSFPRLGGIVAGTATLDSSWLDVRFSNANLVHQDGPGDPTRLTGSGRITYGEPYMQYDLALNAEPVSLTMLSRSYPLHLNGLMSGPVSVKGSTPDLEIAASLQGPAGAFSFNGHVDADSIGGYGARGRGDFNGIALASLLDKSQIPAGPLSGHYDVDVTGETVASLRGSANLALEPTTVKGVRVYQSSAKLRFADGRIAVDSLRIHTKAATLYAKGTGGIGLPHGRPDSLAFEIEIDSLGGLRPLLASADSSSPPDSLIGYVMVLDTLRGTLDNLSTSGVATGFGLTFRNESVDTLDATFSLRDLTHSPVGTLDFQLSKALLAGVALDSVHATLTVSDSMHRRFDVGALSRNGLLVGLGGNWSTEGDVDDVLVDSLGLAVGKSSWRLARPAHLVIDSVGSRLDSLIVRNGDSAFVAFTENIPDRGNAFAQLRAAHIPLRDVGMLFQLRDTISGTADITLSATGTKTKPVVVGDALVSAVRWSGLNVDLATAATHYAEGSLRTTFDVTRNQHSALRGNLVLPATLELLGGSLRRSEPISGSIVADSTDLSIIQPLFPSVKASGLLRGSVALEGTVAAPRYHGTLSIANGSAEIKPLGVTLKEINGTVIDTALAGGQDSAFILASDPLRAKTDRYKGSLRVGGWVKNLVAGLAQPKTPMAFGISIQADSLHAFSRRTLADVYVTTRGPLVLSGTPQASTLRGDLSVDHSSIYLLDADLARKQVVEAILDSATLAASPRAASPFAKLRDGLLISNVNVTLGEDVRLRSAEADVRLGGQLVLSAARGQQVPTLAGQLTTLGGTYNLNLQLVQREFQVLSDGTVTFDGPADNPLLDVKAMYAVKQYHDRDLNVIVDLRGRLKTPTIRFSSDADYEMSQSDVVSYLVLGKPGLDFGANSDARQLLADVIAPTVSAFAAERLRQSGLGSFADVFQFQLGSANLAGSNAYALTSYASFLSGSTIGAETRLTNNLSLNVNTGLCQQNFQGTRSALTGLGAKAEYRLKASTSVQLAYDPPTASRTCNADGQQSIVGLVPTPPNFSLAFSHTWRF